MTIAEKIKTKRLSKGLTLDQVGEMVGVHRSSVKRWEDGEINDMKRKYIAALAKALDMSPIEFLDMDWRENTPPPPNLLTSLHTRRVPMLGAVACGEPIYADGEYGEYVSVDGNIECDFALTCKGDSMIGARIYDGDIVFVRKQDYVDDGSVAVVLLDDEATLKRIYHLADGRIELRPENPRFRSIVIGGENETRTCRILGKAIAFQSTVV